MAAWVDLAAWPCERKLLGGAGDENLRIGLEAGTAGHAYGDSRRHALDQVPGFLHR